MASHNSHKNELNSTRDGLRNSGIKYRGVHRVASGKWCARIEKKGFKRIHIGTYNSAVEAARSYDRMARILHGAEAKLNFIDPSPGRSLASGSAFANIPGVQPVPEAGSVVRTTGIQIGIRTTGIQIGSSGSNTIAVAEPHAAAEEPILPPAMNNKLPTAESSVTGVASRSESANIPIEQEELNKYTEYLNNLIDEDDSPNEEELNEYVEDLKNLINCGKGSKSS